MINRIAISPVWSDPDVNGRIGADGGIVLRSGIQAVLNSVAAIFKTQLGERPMLPQFGMPSRLALFESLGSGRWQDFVSQASVAVRQWDPRVEVVDAQAVERLQQNELIIRMVLRVQGGPDTVSYEVTL